MSWLVYVTGHSLGLSGEEPTEERKRGGRTMDRTGAPEPERRGGRS